MKNLKIILGFMALLVMVFCSACKKEEVAPGTNLSISDTQEADAIIRKLSGSIQLGGVEFLSKEEYDKLPRADVSQFRPIDQNTFLLRASSLQLPLPPVGNQGKEGSCTAFAVAYGGISYYLNALHHLPYTTTGALRSPTFMYNTTKNNGDCNAGANLSNVLLNAIYKGVCSWAQMPYTENNCSQQPTAIQKQQALQGRIQNAYVAYYYQVRQYIQAGYPVVMTFQTDDNFYLQTFRSPFIWQNIGGRAQGNHAVIIMGYDDNKRLFKVQNSWGTGVQDHGFFYLNYDALPYFAKELYVMQPI